MAENDKPNPHPAFAPEGIVWKEYMQKLPFAIPEHPYGDPKTDRIEGMYAEVLGGWLVKPFHRKDTIVFVPRTARP